MIWPSEIIGMWSPGPIEMIIIGVVALLIFGKRLPEVARGLGQSLTQFKKGLKDPEETKTDIIEDELNVKTQE